MQEQLFFDLRKALAQRNMDEVNSIYESLPEEDQLISSHEKYWYLRIEAEIHHFRRSSSQALPFIERALNLVPKLSLTHSQLGSLNGRYASCLYKTKSYRKALEYYTNAKKYSETDIPRNFYYKLKILECLQVFNQNSPPFSGR